MGVIEVIKNIIKQLDEHKTGLTDTEYVNILCALTNIPVDNGEYIQSDDESESEQSNHTLIENVQEMVSIALSEKQQYILSFSNIHIVGFDPSSEDKLVGYGFHVSRKSATVLLTSQEYELCLNLKGELISDLLRKLPDLSEKLKQQNITYDDVRQTTFYDNDFSFILIREAYILYDVTPI